MNMRKVVIKGIVISVLCVTLVFGVYLLQNQFSRPMVIGTTYMTLNNNFYKAINDEIKKRSGVNNVQVITRDPALDANLQAKQIRDLVAERVDVLIINPVDGTNQKIIDALAYAKQQGVGIIDIDTPLERTTAIHTTIVSDNYQAGVLCAQKMMKLQKSARIFLLTHVQAFSAVDRIKGFLDTIKGHQKYQVVGRRNCLGQTDLAMKETQAFIKSKVSFNTLMALNDPSALGALAAFEEAHLKQINIYSVDGSPEMKKLMMDMPTIQTIAAQSPLTMADKAFVNAQRLYEHQKTVKKIVIPVVSITQKNKNNYDVTGWQ